MMTPSITDIVKTCLKIAKKIIFYLPRTLDVEELFEILDTFTMKKDNIYLDIQILNSANKTKAVLLIFGNEIAEVLIIFNFFLEHFK